MPKERAFQDLPLDGEILLMRAGHYEDRLFRVAAQTVVIGGNARPKKIAAVILESLPGELDDLRRPPGTPRRFPCRGSMTLDDLNAYCHPPGTLRNQE